MDNPQVLNNKRKRLSRAFTLFELLIVIALLMLITAATLSFGINFLQEQRIEEEAVSLAEKIKEARARASAGQEDSSWGIRFNYPQQGKYTLFMGDSFEEPGRETKYDEIFLLSSGAEIELPEGIEEIVFEKLTGKLILK